MAGQVKHTKIFGGIVPDLTFLSVLKELGSRNTDGLIGAVAKVLRDRGIELIDSTALLTPLLAAPRCADRAVPYREEQKDFEFGYPMADAIAGLDIGQTDRREASGRRGGRGDGRHRRGDRSRRTAGRRRRAHHQGGEAEPGHALRRAGDRARDDSGDARRRRVGAVDRRGQDADVRPRRDDRVGQRSRHHHRRDGRGA